ncbi:Uncharacterised protein [Mycobacteroides abscessus subsp. abscessus]|nr:Uncharacterised protein [Mycobacteroides abscessus subsp. abscessus]
MAPTIAKTRPLVIILRWERARIAITGWGTSGRGSWGERLYSGPSSSTSSESSSCSLGSRPAELGSTGGFSPDS